MKDLISYHGKSPFSPILIEVNSNYLRTYILQLIVVCYFKLKRGNWYRAHVQWSVCNVFISINL